MQKYNLLELVEYGEESLPKVLVNQPGYSLVLFNIRSEGIVSQPIDGATVTIYAISGHVTICRDETSVELYAGDVLWSEGDELLRIKARGDASLLVVSATYESRREEELDLRTVERFQRHPMVFQRFDRLNVGESFVLVNDHDPIPLHRQLDAMRPHQLNWEYIIRGPGVFRIEIRRIAPLSGSETSLSTLPQNLSNILPTR